MSIASKCLIVGVFSARALASAPECGSEKCAAAGEVSSLLQVPVYPHHTRWAWKTEVESYYYKSLKATLDTNQTQKAAAIQTVPADDRSAVEDRIHTQPPRKSCDDICHDYGAVCVPEGFKEASCPTGVQFAHLSAEGEPCENGPPTQSDTAWAPYHGEYKGCFYTTSHNISAARCEERPPDYRYSRLCPCSITRPHSIMLEGTYCKYVANAKIDCNFVDDFKSDTSSANTCRILNGFYSSPIHHTKWVAHRNLHPVDTYVKGYGKCYCSFMADKNGLGDDCRRCDTCALACREKNPFPIGTCR